MMMSLPNAPKSGEIKPDVDIQNVGSTQKMPGGCITRLSDQEARQISNQLKALSHPVRLQILQYLGESNSCCCNDFCACIPLAQSTISQHLKILNKAGIIDSKPAGNRSHYSVNQNALIEITNALNILQELTLSPKNISAEKIQKDNPDGKS